MKRVYAAYYIVLLLLISVCPGLKSQDLFVDAAGERIQVCTDRTMYVSGEKIFFSTVIFNKKGLIAEEFSRTFYCELITPDGNKIASRKYLLNNSSGQGCIGIPEETITGIYFLKFYTRFMRNIGTDEYKYILLKIINPYKTEVLSGNDILDTTDLSEKNKEVQEGAPSLNILSGRKIFSPREEIRLSIKENTGKRSPARICISVIPESTYRYSVPPVKTKKNEEKSGVYFPETRGISLSGQLIAKESGKPVPAAKVNLSIIGDKDILVVRTDAKGRFFFALPDYYGTKDIFLCADDLPDITPEIFIDNDFCSRPVYLPSPRLVLDEDEMKAAFKLAVNSSITSMFRGDTLADSRGEENKTSFYGKPSGVLLIDKYIDMPTLGEYFTDLPGEVKLRKIQGS